jgi:hypothetical protein
MPHLGLIGRYCSPIIVRWPHGITVKCRIIPIPVRCVSVGRTLRLRGRSEVHGRNQCLPMLESAPAPLQSRVTTFFGVTDLPPPDVASDALTAQHFAASKDYCTCAMLFNMDCVTDPDTDPINRGPETINFVKELFNVMRSIQMRRRRDFRYRGQSYISWRAREGPQRWTSALGTTPMSSYWSSKWTGNRAGSIRSPDLFRMPLLPSITTT